MATLPTPAERGKGSIPTQKIHKSFLLHTPLGYFIIYATSVSRRLSLTMRDWTPSDDHFQPSVPLRTASPSTNE
jgi:hypothetical protein